jgi:hypothetical protein
MKEHPTHKGYFVTEDGRVFSNRSGKLRELKQQLILGYLRVYFCTKVPRKQYPKRVHRLVAETYIPNPHNLPQVNHKDEDKTNNHLSNLEWCDSQYNNEYTFAKNWKIKTPTNEIVEVFNLKKFCRENNLNDSHLRDRGKSKGFFLIRTEQQEGQPQSSKPILV